MGEDPHKPRWGDGAEDPQKGCSSTGRHGTWICCTMLRSWTRNSFASLALSDSPFRAWESWLCRGKKEQGHFHLLASSLCWSSRRACRLGWAPSAVPAPPSRGAQPSEVSFCPCCPGSGKGKRRVSHHLRGPGFGRHRPGVPLLQRWSRTRHSHLQASHPLPPPGPCSLGSQAPEILQALTSVLRMMGKRPPESARK